MKNLISNQGKSFVLVLLLFLSQACSESLLNEEPYDFLSPDITLVNNSGFQSALTSLHNQARSLVSMGSSFSYLTVHFATDIGTIGIREEKFRDYNTQLTPTTTGVNYFWEWGYLQMLPRANQIIDYAQRPAAVWESENEKNAVIAEAKFFRAFTLNILTNLYGDIPIVAEIITEPKVDYKRDAREDVLEFVKADLEFASEWLPPTVESGQEGRIVKAAADHLLAEVNISLGLYDEAIESASEVINSGLYHLMTERFGSVKDQPGDVYSDLFKDGNQNRSSGNMESIWVLQYEFLTPGGGDKLWLRAWGVGYFNIRDPNGDLGMVLTDSLGRGVSWMRPSNHIMYTIWQEDPGDMRNSPYNIRRTWYYNNPASAYYGQAVKYHPDLDTLWACYPQFRKIESKVPAANSGSTHSDFAIMRLAETYLLRAEAYLMKDDKQNAANDINAVRARSHAKPVDPNRVDLDYILDERLRELLIEEPRRLTLNRMGKTVERVRKYNGLPITMNSIQDHNLLLPIPQKFIDANFGNKIEQNPGYH